MPAILFDQLCLKSLKMMIVRLTKFSPFNFFCAYSSHKPRHIISPRGPLGSPRGARRNLESSIATQKAKMAAIKFFVVIYGYLS